MTPHQEVERFERKRGRRFTPKERREILQSLGIGLGIGLGVNSGANSGPTPLSILGGAATKLWLRADLGVSGLGTTGAVWADQSGNWGATWTQATVANQATLALDATIGQLAFTFDGVNDVWTSTGLFPAQASTPYAFIIVAKIPSYAVASKPLIGSSSYGPAIATQASSKLGPQAGAIGPQVVGNTGWKRIICELTNSTADRIQQGSVSATGASSSSARTTGPSIGGLPSDGAWLACSVTEVIIASPIPGSYTAIDTYLSGRYTATVLT